MHCVTAFVDVLHSIAFNCVDYGVFLLKITVFDMFVLFIQFKNCMITSESKGRFFLQTNRIESIRIANWNALLFTNFAALQAHVTARSQSGFGGTRGLGTDGSPPAGSRGRAPGEGFGWRSPLKAHSILRIGLLLAVIYYRIWHVESIFKTAANMHNVSNVDA